MSKPRHNPERRSWRGKSYKKGGTRVATLASASHAERFQASLEWVTEEHAELFARLAADGD